MSSDVNSVNNNPNNEREKIIIQNNEYDNLPIIKLIKSDINLFKSNYKKPFLSIGFYVVLNYRISHFLYKNNLNFLSVFFQIPIRMFTFCNIHRSCKIGPGFIIHHPTCIFIGPNLSIGRDFNLGPRTFLASLYKYDDPNDCPVISNGVTLTVGSVVVGGISIGEGVIAGPNSVVLKNIPPFHNIAASPSRSFKRMKNGWDKRIITNRQYIISYLYISAFLSVSINSIFKPCFA